MKKFVIFNIISFCFFIHPGFAKKYYITPFLEKVERVPAGETDTNIVTDKNGTYKDPLLSITWNPDPLGFHFKLTNESEATISVIWDECYLEIAFLKYAIVHRGIKDIRVMPPTNIIPRNTFSDFLYPAVYARYVQGRYTERRHKAIYKEKVKKKMVDSNTFISQQFIAILTLKSGKNQYAYHFHFKTELVEK